MEEVYCWVGAVAADYEWNCLIFEGPGQWGALMENPGLVFRPDYEKPMAAAVDYLHSRDDIDRDKIALIGYSAGDYFAPRDASGEPRIKACIANTLVVDCGESARAGLKGLSNPRVIDTMFRLLQKFSPPARWGLQHAQWSLGIAKPHDWIDFYRPFTLRGLEQNFRNRMPFLFEEDDIKDAATSSAAIVAGIPEFIASLPCDSYLHVFPRTQGASSHCQIGGLTYAHVVIFQWLDHVFSGGPLPAKDLGAPAQPSSACSGNTEATLPRPAPRNSCTPQRWSKPTPHHQHQAAFNLPAAHGRPAYAGRASSLLTRGLCAFTLTPVTSA